MRQTPIFEFEWTDLEPKSSPVIDATAALLRIKVGEEVISRYHDPEVDAIKEYIPLSLYPLAEWLAINWWALRYETNPSRGDYKYRHNIRYGREGFALPDVEIRNMGEGEVKLTSTPANLISYNLRFLAESHGSLPEAAVWESIEVLIRAVLERLNEKNLTDTLLHQHWTTIETTSMDKEEVEFCEAAALLGLDPYDLAEGQADRILTTADFEHPLRRQFLEAAMPDTLQTQSESLNRSLEQIRLLQADLKHLRAIGIELNRVSQNGHQPWEQGYRYAQALRTKLGSTDTIHRTFDDVIVFLGLPAGEIDKGMLQVESAGLFAALTALTEQGSPAFALDSGRKREESKKFAFSRALYEALRSTGTTPALITEANTAAQQRNRAFAAEFLAPSHILNEHLRQIHPYYHFDTTDDLAQEFNVSSDVIRFQIKNHRLVKRDVFDQFFA